MNLTDVVVIGAGQAGLAMSRCLAGRGIPHVVLERGDVAESWRAAHWETLRLLSPNWQTRLPGWRYDGEDPDGFMSRHEFVRYLERYATSFGAPVRAGAEVVAVRPRGSRYEIETRQGHWLAPVVVAATGHCQHPSVPAFAARLSPSIRQLTPSRYRRPSDFDAPVLVVGASTTGVQIAEELQRSGRQTVLAVGRHIRLPRRYRGRDIMWWLDRLGILDERVETMADPDRARRQPGLQLVGRSDGRCVDLATLQDAGVQLVGRARVADGTTVGFAPDLAETTAAAEDKLRRLLQRIDAFIDASRVPAPPAAPQRRIVLPPVRTRIDLAAAGIGSVIWATGYARRYPWLPAGVLDPAGEIIHQGGTTPAPGLYALGLRFMRRRKSSFIDGVGADALDLAADIARYLRTRRRLAA